MRKIIAIIVAKLAIIIGKIMRRGSSLPGYLAIRIDNEIGKKLDVSGCTIIGITGANGKSTTTALLAEIFKANGYIVAANLKGSNMRPGVFTGILEKTTLLGKVRADIILMEVDEFSSPKVYDAIKPDYLVMTNVLRDHIERQSDISNVLEKIADKLPKSTTLILNGDDPLVASLNYTEMNPRIYYGIRDDMHGVITAEGALAGKFCLQCGEKLGYQRYYYEHIGVYKCPSCDFGDITLDFIGTDINLKGHTMDINGEQYSVNYDAFYMYYNVLAAVAISKTIGITHEQIQKVTENFVVGNARLEHFYLHERLGIMNFLKNATSLSATIDLIVADKQEKTVVFVMDDTYDGRYFITQWYWDAKVEKLAEDETIQYFVCTWKRAYDMAVRLKAAGVSSEKIIVEPDMEKAVGILREQTTGNIYLGYDTDSHSISKVVSALAKFPENIHLRK
ncbi:UDP-N-acetylmuramyl peptide synthase [Erysipelotrichaceae bacterium]|nr:UDP-N-acetylmuramyl peptide synthase [Erysipelotrichaceae bacterium]